MSALFECTEPGSYSQHFAANVSLTASFRHVWYRAEIGNMIVYNSMLAVPQFAAMGFEATITR